MQLCHKHKNKSKSSERLRMSSKYMSEPDQSDSRLTYVEY